MDRRDLNQLSADEQHGIPNNLRIEPAAIGAPQQPVLRIGVIYSGSNGDRIDAGLLPRLGNAICRISFLVDQPFFMNLAAS